MLSCVVLFATVTTIVKLTSAHCYHSSCTLSVSIALQAKYFIDKVTVMKVDGVKPKPSLKILLILLCFDKQTNDVKLKKIQP